MRATPPERVFFGFSVSALRLSVGPPAVVRHSGVEPFPADRPGRGALRLPAVRPDVERHSGVESFPVDRPGRGALRFPAVRPAVVRHSDVEIVPGRPARPWRVAFACGAAGRGAPF